MYIGLSLIILSDFAYRLMHPRDYAPHQGLQWLRQTQRSHPPRLIRERGKGAPVFRSAEFGEATQRAGVTGTARSDDRSQSTRVELCGLAYSGLKKVYTLADP